MSPEQTPEGQAGDIKAGFFATIWDQIKNPIAQVIAATILLVIAGLVTKHKLSGSELTYIAFTKTLKADVCKSISSDKVAGLLSSDNNYSREQQIWKLSIKENEFDGTLSLDSAGNKSQEVVGFLPDAGHKFIAIAKGSTDTAASYYLTKAAAGKYYKGYQTAHDCESDVDLQCPYLLGLIDNKESFDQEWIKNTPCQKAD